MRKILLYFFLMSFVVCENVCKEDIESAITFESNHGRFGDNIQSYAKTKWISCKTGIPVLYLPFPYSQDLMLSELEKPYLPEYKKLFKEVIYLPASGEIKFKKNNVLYISHWNAFVSINWNDPFFKSELRKAIAPRYSLEKIKRPEGYFSIAVHIRRGGGFSADNAREKERCPLRFVPDEFFINQIARVVAMVPQQKIYVHIFTDDANPAEIVKKYKMALANNAIKFGYREKGNSHKSNVLEDFFSMMDFDCLIRPGSHFSRFVERLGNNKIVVYPFSTKKGSHGKNVIDVVALKTRVLKGWKTIKYRVA